MGAYLPSGRAGHSSSSALSLEQDHPTSSFFKKVVLYGVESSLLGGVGEVGYWKGGAGLVHVMPLSMSSTKVAVPLLFKWRPSRLRRWRWNLQSTANLRCPMKWSCLCCLPMACCPRSTCWAFWFRRSRCPRLFVAPGKSFAVLGRIPEMRI